MSATTTNYYRACIKTLQSLYKDHPSFPLGSHIATALDGYGDAWGLSDKELYFALKRYQTLLEMDKTKAHEKYVEDVVKQGIQLESMFPEEEEDDEENNW